KAPTTTSRARPSPRTPDTQRGPTSPAHPSQPEDPMSQIEHREPEPATLADFTAQPGDSPGAWTLLVTGEVDVASSPALRAKIAELLDQGAEKIVLDLRGLTFIDSSGLGRSEEHTSELQSQSK